MDLDRKNNYYYNNDQYKSIANLENEIIKCNNINLNLNGNEDELTSNSDNHDNKITKDEAGAIIRNILKQGLECKNFR